MEELRATVHRVLQEWGTGILSNPKRFLGCILDFADADNPVVMVFESNCDSELMEFFSKMAANPMPEVIEAEANRTTSLLVEKRFIHADVARLMVCEIASGICDNAGTVVPEGILATVRAGFTPNDAPWQQVKRDWEREHFNPADDWQDDTTTTEKLDTTRNSKTVLLGNHEDDKEFRKERRTTTTPSTKWDSDQQTEDSRLPRPRLAIVLASIVLVALVTMGTLLLWFPSPSESSHETSSITDSDLSDAISASKSKSSNSTDSSPYLGTWSPTSISGEYSESKTYETKLRVAREGDLVVRNDGTFSRVLFPSLLMGTWEEDEDGSLSMRAESANDIVEWDTADLNHSIIANIKDSNGEKLLTITYGDGITVDYGRDTKQFDNTDFEGLWEVIEAGRGGVVQYGQDVFDAERANGWYTNYIDLRSNGTVIWDLQSAKSQGNWRISNDGQAIAYIRKMDGSGSYWCGLMELGEDELTFYYDGEDNWETYRRVSKDNRTELKVPD